MSPFEFKIRTGHPVEFKGQGSCFRIANEVGRIVHTYNILKEADQNPSALLNHQLAALTYTQYNGSPISAGPTPTVFLPFLSLSGPGPQHCLGSPHRVVGKSRHSNHPVKPLKYPWILPIRAIGVSIDTERRIGEYVEDFG